MNSEVFEEFIEYVFEMLDIPEDDDVSREFITNFITIINNGEDFQISLEDVIGWLDIYEHGIRRTLERSYKPGIDYVKYTVKTKGRPKLITYISNECFKNLCMKTQSKNGKLIRTYFIVVEEMYREYMLGGILDRQRADDHEYQDKKYQKERYEVGKCVYVIRIVDKGNQISYKVGQTKNINRRLAEHKRQIAGKVNLVLYELYDHHEFLESCVHRFLKPYRKDGKLREIFEADIEKIYQLIQKCREFSQSPEMLALMD